jgi:hypothetical protein
MLSAFGSAALVALIMAIVYFFRYTNRGRIFLDRIGRPGEYDDEQQFLREEEEAMAEMDEMQRAEYLRAKGGYSCLRGRFWMMYADFCCSFRAGESSRVDADGYLTLTVFGHSRERSVSMGV